MPESDDQRTIDELLTLYETEPTLCDLFVEGSSDKAVIEWFLEEVGIKEVAVYEISTVYVPYDEVRKQALEDNNRGRVIALACALYSQSKSDLTESVGCVVDTDFDYLLQKEYGCPLLIFTIFTSLEMYLFDRDLIAKFLRLFARTFQLNVSRMLGSFIPVLTDLFLIRLANQELEFGIEPLPLSKACKIEANKIIFDSKAYILKYLDKGAQRKQQGLFMQTIEKYRVRALGDARCFMHGHDFVNLLMIYLNKITKPKPAYQYEFFARSLISALEPRYIESKPLFAEIKARYSV